MNKDLDKNLLDHEYDGIKELDNPLPGWWLATFYGTVIFTVFYIGYYHVGGGPSLKDELAADLSAIQSNQQTATAGKPAPTEEALLAVYNDSAKREAGKKVFVEKCAACHGPDGGGSIGPNLTDKFWIHGDGKMSSMIQTVTNGVADKGMPAWGTLLKDEELVTVVAYAYSLKGTTPQNPKAAQGNEVP